MTATTVQTPLEVAANFLVHLRLHFQLLLAPIFLWGWLLAGTQASLASILLAFIAFHVCLYGGTTAFNSYYDQDKGPVGGLRTPPPAARPLLMLSLILQAIGFLLAGGVRPALGLCYLAIFLLATAYSHPRVRLKARPWASIVTVAFGQGTLGFLAGWLAAGGTWSALWQPDVVIGALGVSFFTVGYYPLTQVYQIAEDCARGDHTFAVRYGPTGSFRFALACLGVAVLGVGGVIAARYGWLDLVLVGLFAGCLLVLILRWWRGFHRQDIYGNFAQVMRIHALMSLGFLGYLLVRLGLSFT